MARRSRNVLLAVAAVFLVQVRPVGPAEQRSEAGWGRGPPGGDPTSVALEEERALSGGPNPSFRSAEERVQGDHMLLLPPPQPLLSGLPPRTACRRARPASSARCCSLFSPCPSLRQTGSCFCADCDQVGGHAAHPAAHDGPGRHLLQIRAPPPIRRPPPPRWVLRTAGRRRHLAWLCTTLARGTTVRIQPSSSTAATASKAALLPALVMPPTAGRHPRRRPSPLRHLGRPLRHLGLLRAPSRPRECSGWS